MVQMKLPTAKQIINDETTDVLIGRCLGRFYEGVHEELTEFFGKPLSKLKGTEKRYYRQMEHIITHSITGKGGTL